MKIKKYIAVGFLSLTVGGFLLPTLLNISVYAQSEITYTDRTLTNVEIEQITKYIKIQNNRYILESNNDLSKELNYLAKKHIEKTNSLLEQYNGNLFVDNSSKTILGSTLLDRSPGKNDVEFHWNYARIYIDAPNIRLLGSGMIGAAAGGLGFALKTFGLSVLISAISNMVGQKLSEVQDGIWFDYNYFETFTGGIGLPKIMGVNYGWQ